jgi:hypothetical protein
MVLLRLRDRFTQLLCAFVEVSEISRELFFVGNNAFLHNEAFKMLFGVLVGLVVMGIEFHQSPDRAAPVAGEARFEFLD